MSGDKSSTYRDSRPIHTNLNSTTIPDFKVYKPLNSNSATTRVELPDSYFTPTPADLKAAQEILATRTKALVDAPLQLRAAREATERAKHDRWPNTTIRVKFPDRTQLERIFPSTDKIRSVYAFVRSCLREDVKPIKFILYQSPPKRDLKVSDPNVRDLSLAELHLAPSSVLLLRFESVALNASTMTAPLMESVLSQAIDFPVPPAIEDFVPDDQPVPSASSKSSQAQKKIPKWLKLGQKK